MELQTIEIPRAGARQLAADYMREAKRTSDPIARQEFEQIARAYRIAARDDVPLIALTPTIASGGTVVRTLVSYAGRENEQRVHHLLPALAVMRASARFAYTLGVQRDGSLELQDRMGRRDDFRSAKVQFRRNQAHLTFVSRCPGLIATLPACARSGTALCSSASSGSRSA